MKEESSASSRLHVLHRYYVVICNRAELCEQQALSTSFCERGELATARKQLRGHRIRKTRRKSSESTEEKVLILPAACLCAALHVYVLGSCQKTILMYHTIFFFVAGNKLALLGAMI